MDNWEQATEMHKERPGLKILGSILRLYGTELRLGLVSAIWFLFPFKHSDFLKEFTDTQLKMFAEVAMAVNSQEVKELALVLLILKAFCGEC